MKTINQNVQITMENQNEWLEKTKDVETISNSVYVYENAKFNAPKLETINGYVYVYENAKFNAPKLKQSNSVYVYENTKFNAPKLKQSNSVYVYENAKFNAPKLETINGYVYVRENAKFNAPKLETINGYVYVYENTKFNAPKLETINGYVYVYENAKLEKQLWKIASKNKWYITEKSSEWLIKKEGNFEYSLNGVALPKEWFNQIRKDELTPDEVFAIDNIEHRRIAYQFMDKAKMKQLKDYKILDEVADDGEGNPAKIVEFNVKQDNKNIDLRFLNCICPDTGREYFLETRQTKVMEAKMGSFGLSSKIKFDNKNNYRHGDLACVKISELPDGLEKTKTKILLTGSHKHDHFIDKGEVYFNQVDAYVFGYLVADDTTLDHIEHHKRYLKNGIYELRKQNEERNNELIPVID